MMRMIASGFLVIASIIFLSAPVVADGGKIRTGKFTIVPRLTVQGVYDDNVFLGSGTKDPTNEEVTRREKEESDRILHIMPALLLDYSLGVRGSVNLGYAGDVARYDDFSDNDWQNHQGSFGLDYYAPGGLIVGVDNVYLYAEDPYSSLNEYELGTAGIERWSDNLGTKIGFEFSDKFRVLAYYNYYKQDYDRDQDFTQDYDFNELGAGLQMRLLPKTWGFMQYHYGERDYFTHLGDVTEDNDADFDWHRVNAGLTWDSGAKLSGELNLGYQWKAYNNATDFRGASYDDKDTWVASTSISSQATENTMVSLTVLRALRDRGSNTNEYFEDTGIGLGLQQVVLEKMIFTVNGLYSEHDYNEWLGGHRKDDNYRASLDFEYRIKDWVRAGLGYKYWKKDSNAKEYGFTDNQFMATIEIVY